MQRVILEIGGNFVSKTEIKLSNMVLNIRTYNFCCSKHFKTEISRFRYSN